MFDFLERLVPITKGRGVRHFANCPTTIGAVARRVVRTAIDEGMFEIGRKRIEARHRNEGLCGNAIEETQKEEQRGWYKSVGRLASFVSLDVGQLFLTGLAASNARIMQPAPQIRVATTRQSSTNVRRTFTAE